MPEIATMGGISRNFRMKFRNADSLSRDVSNASKGKGDAKALQNSAIAVRKQILHATLDSERQTYLVPVHVIYLTGGGNFGILPYKFPRVIL